MQWLDDGIIISLKPLGEHSKRMLVLTQEHGLHAGVVRYSQKKQGVLQPGNRVQVKWQARLAEHIGTWTVELQESVLGYVIGESGALAVLSSACALVEVLFPEREQNPWVYTQMRDLLGSFKEGLYYQQYCHFELMILHAFGVSLDLTKCAATGQVDDLYYVSPKSGRAVSRKAGEPYKDKLLRLPVFLSGQGEQECFHKDIYAGLKLTERFLRRDVFDAQDLMVPSARERLQQNIEQRIV